MNNLKLLPSIFPETAMLELPQDQYHALSTINMYLGRNDGIKWPYFYHQLSRDWKIVYYKHDNKYSFWKS